MGWAGTCVPSRPGTESVLCVLALEMETDSHVFGDMFMGSQSPPPHTFPVQLTSQSIKSCVPKLNCVLLIFLACIWYLLPGPFIQKK